ncbi:MAG: AAA family ATPase [Bacteroidetes bacterium]|nr:AAA family ATPase [Bacteroidota bacterium]
MTLKETFSKYTLTSGQNGLLDELDKFLSDKSTCFLLKGYAGTGKTFMMKGLTDFLTETKRSFRIAAPTGRAAKVISQKTKHKAYTIHKTIYSSKDLKEFKTKNEDGTETFKFYYELKHNEDPDNTIYIIDEASMLSNVYSEGEFFRFGSGYLLKDLINYINFDNNDHNKKVIFIGDNAQLPPVNMNFSPALDGKYLQDNCNLVSSEFELTEVVRQKAESGILHNATKLRQSLKANIFNQLDIETSFNDINKTKHEELLSKYLEACNNSIDEETIIVAYSNSSVKEYNDFVRNHFFPNQNTITVKDKIILVSNNYNYPQMELLNGDFGIVKEVSTINESRTIKLKRKNRRNETIEINVPLTFRNVTITFTDEEFKKHDIQCKIIENLLYSRHRDLSSDELKALYIDFKIRNEKLKSGTKEFKDAIRSDVYFNALRIKFGYAVTCHKAQGGEWANTFLNCKTSMGYFNSSYFRWLYTGITRAKENLYTLDEPHFAIGSNLQPPKIENFQPREDILTLNTEISEIELPFDFSNQTKFVKHIYLIVSECLKDENVNINDIRHTNYLEHYTISQGNETAVFKINYNSHNKITTIQKPSNSTEFVESVYSKIVKLQHKLVIVSEPEIKETEFEFEQEFLREHYELRKRQMFEKNINIIKIEHHKYQEVYTFHKNGFKAVYRFYYNGQCRFTRFDIDRNQTTGLVDEINELLKNEVSV